MSHGPLQGLRVLDIGTLIAGPFGASLLADFGADVIKVEQPGAGDVLRTSGGHQVEGISLTWLSNARNKRSVTLNLREAAGQTLFLELVRTADVVIENFTPGTLERWNIGPEVLRGVNPRLILIRVSGFGFRGSARPGRTAVAPATTASRLVTAVSCTRRGIRTVRPCARHSRWRTLRPRCSARSPR
jgi:crotonobetainyl-CoA:carnitine CoA-transferase CaiB-like acyl-CoA transferase